MPAPPNGLIPWILSCYCLVNHSHQGCSCKGHGQICHCYSIPPPCIRFSLLITFGFIQHIIFLLWQVCLTSYLQGCTELIHSCIGCKPCPPYMKVLPLCFRAPKSSSISTKKILLLRSYDFSILEWVSKRM